MVLVIFHSSILPAPPQSFRSKTSGKLMECGHNHRISKDDVVAKLKDDGDFDRLRLKIIRKLKEDVSNAHLTPTISLSLYPLFFPL